MLHLFEVHLAPGTNPDTLLSKELQRDTGAQVMTLDEAKALGFGGIKQPEGRELRLIAVAARDSQWVHRTLEASPDVTTYRVHEVDT